MRWLFITLAILPSLLSIPPKLVGQAYWDTPSQHRCMAYAMYREASGESYEAARGVLDVIISRSIKEHKKPCEILAERRQFPYFKYGVKEIPLISLAKYVIVSNMNKVVDEDVLFFNNVPLAFGKQTRKIGHIYFSK